MSPIWTPPSSGISVKPVPRPLDGLGGALRLLRGERSQQSVALAAGIDPGTLNRIEHGKQMPDSNTINGVLAVLGVDIWAFASALSDAGRARPAWVGVMLARGTINGDILHALLAASDPADKTAAADLGPSAMAAARQMADMVLGELSMLEAPGSDTVNEPEPPYDGGSKRGKRR